MTSAVDFFATPQPIAEAMLDAVSIVNPSTVADFAAGDGALLACTMSRWPAARLIATDRDATRVRHIRLTFPTWTVGRVDFLNPKSRQASTAVSRKRGAIDLVLLNPPFSCRGNRTVESWLHGRLVKSSIAMAFVTTAMEYLGDGGEAICILPESAVTGEKDRSAWSVIADRYSTEIVARCSAKTFKSAFARTMIIRLSERSISRNVEECPSAKNEANGPLVRVIRGSVSMTSVERGHPAVPLVHTTDLIKGKVKLSGRMSGKVHRLVAGPAVLVPRVGRPDVRKISIVRKGNSVILSDCVFGLCVRKGSEATALRELITRDWRRFGAGYSGTCAPYLRLEFLQRYLLESGYAVQVVRGRPPSG